MILYFYDRVWPPNIQAQYGIGSYITLICSLLQNLLNGTDSTNLTRISHDKNGTKLKYHWKWKTNPYKTWVSNYMYQ